MNQIGIFVFWLFGICFGLLLLWGLLIVTFKMYVELRDKVLYAIKMEGLIFVYRRHKNEIDDYIKNHYPDEVNNQ